MSELSRYFRFVDWPENIFLILIVSLNLKISHALPVPEFGKLEIFCGAGSEKKIQINVKMQKRLSLNAREDFFLRLNPEKNRSRGRDRKNISSQFQARAVLCILTTTERIGETDQRRSLQGYLNIGNIISI